MSIKKKQTNLGEPPKPYIISKTHNPLNLTPRFIKEA